MQTLVVQTSEAKFYQDAAKTQTCIFLLDEQVAEIDTPSQPQHPFLVVPISKRTDGGLVCKYFQLNMPLFDSLADLNRLDQLDLLVQAVYTFATKCRPLLPFVQTIEQPAKIKLTLQRAGASVAVEATVGKTLIFALNKSCEDEGENRAALVAFLNRWRKATGSRVNDAIVGLKSAKNLFDSFAYATKLIGGHQQT